MNFHNAPLTKTIFERSLGESHNLGDVEFMELPLGFLQAPLRRRTKLMRSVYAHLPSFDSSSTYPDNTLRSQVSTHFEHLLRNYLQSFDRLLHRLVELKFDFPSHCQTGLHCRCLPQGPNYSLNS